MEHPSDDELEMMRPLYEHPATNLSALRVALRGMTNTIFGPEQDRQRPIYTLEPNRYMYEQHEIDELNQMGNE